MMERIWYGLGTVEFWLMNWPHTRLLRRPIGAVRSWMWRRQALSLVQGAKLRVRVPPGDWVEVTPRVGRTVNKGKRVA